MRMMILTEKVSGDIVLVNPHHCRLVYGGEDGSSIDFGDHDDATLRVRESQDDIGRIWSRSLIDSAA